MSVDNTASHRHRVVIIGSGFGGLFGTKHLKRADVDVTLISKTTHHLFQPLLYQVATGILSVGEIAPATRLILRKQKNAEVLLGDVVDIDLANKTVTSRLLDRERGHAVRQPDRRRGRAAVLLRQRPFRDLRAGHEDHRRRPRAARPHPRRVRAGRGDDVGGRTRAPADVRRRRRGPTGVELAGQIAELADRTLAGAFRTIDPAEARVILVEAAPAVLPPMGPKLGGKAQRRLEKMGVEIQLNTMVTDVDYRA